MGKKVTLNMIFIVLWIIMGLLASIDFDTKSIVIWLAVVTIIKSRLQVIGFL